jgi:sulfide:quinone oxidoreductase
MPEPFRRLTGDFYVAPQLELGDFAAAAALGVRTVINNRPDGEAADQLSDAAAAAAARAAGLDYVHVPVVSGAMTEDDLRAFRAALDAHQGPYLAYCRSGTRSCHLWAFTAARELPIDYVIAAARTAGYELDAARPALERLARQPS